MPDTTELPLLATGRTWQEMPVGLAFRTSGRTITEADLVSFLGLSLYTEPLFLDADHAAEQQIDDRYLAELREVHAAAELARQERAAAHIEVVAVFGRTGGVAAPGHRRQRVPCIGLGIEALVFHEGPLLLRELAAEHDRHALVIGIGEAAARGRQWRPRGPGVGGGIVDVVHVGAVAGAGGEAGAVALG